MFLGESGGGGHSAPVILVLSRKLGAPEREIKPIEAISEHFALFIRTSDMPMGFGGLVVGSVF